MSRMLRVTFYSYKGGVGRTLALLNVAAVLARHGRRVVAVDLDLEAPGFGLSQMTKRLNGARGASDLILGRQERKDVDIHECVYPILTDDCDDRLRLMPAGTRAGELIERLSGFYVGPDNDDQFLFEWLAASIGDTFEPDYLLFDSRTGRAEIAGVCTLELPDVVVAVSGLNEQNIHGMADVLNELSTHPARVQPVATVLVLSPVPRPSDLGVLAARDLFADPLRPVTAADIGRQRESNPLFDAIYRAQGQLYAPIQQWFAAVRGDFPKADTRDLYHELPYDPMVPLSDELHVTQDTELRRAYERLARTLTLLHPEDKALEIAAPTPPPILLMSHD